MSNNQKDIKELADNLWVYFKPKIAEMLSDKISFYRAYITTPYGGNTQHPTEIGIKRPFDEQEIFLPCVNTMQTATVGSQVTVMVFGKNNVNAIIIGDGSLSNILANL